MKSAAGTAPPPTPAGLSAGRATAPSVRLERLSLERKAASGGILTGRGASVGLQRSAAFSRGPREAPEAGAAEIAGIEPLQTPRDRRGAPGGIWASGLSQQDAAGAGTAEAILGCLRRGAKAGPVLSGMRRTECSWSARFELPQAKKDGRSCNGGRDLQELGRKSRKTRTRDGWPKEDNLPSLGKVGKLPSGSWRG